MNTPEKKNKKPKHSFFQKGFAARSAAGNVNHDLYNNFQHCFKIETWFREIAEFFGILYKIYERLRTSYQNQWHSRQQRHILQQKLSKIENPTFLTNICGHFDIGEVLQPDEIPWEVQQDANMIDLLKSFQPVFGCENRHRYNRERASQRYFSIRFFNRVWPRGR